MFVKIAEGVVAEIKAVQADDPVIQERFAKVAAELKKLAPKADDFLYFSAVMMHAAEASAINPDGSPKRTKKGEDVRVWWEDLPDGGRKFCSNDSAIKAYRNSRRDIFPESELITHHAKWRNKPLCVDHKSDSVDHVRGFIVDTYYDTKLKRVVALCALDKINYPDLARKVSTRYSSDVSMGTGVGRAICYDCGKVARAEKDFCEHMRYKTTYGEINMDLEPIELSIVVIGADPNAKIKHVIAAAEAMGDYIDSKQKQLQSAFASGVVDIKSFKKELEESLIAVANLQKEAGAIAEATNNSESDEEDFVDEKETDGISTTPPARIANMGSMMFAVKGLEERIKNLTEQVNHVTIGNSMATRKEAFFNGTEEPTLGKPKYEKDPLAESARKEDATRVEDAVTGPTGISKGDADLKDSVNRTASRREQAVKIAQDSLARKQAFFNGTEEPTLGKPKYEKDPLAESARKEDATRVEDAVTGPTGISKGDADLKDSVNRTASYQARFALTKSADGSPDVKKSEWRIVDRQTDKILVRASVAELGEFETVATREFGSSFVDMARKMGAQQFSKLFKAAQDVPPPPAPGGDVPPAPHAPPAPPAPPTGPTAGSAKDNKEEDPKEKILGLADAVESTSSDLKELVKEQFGEETEMKDLVTAASSLSPQIKKGFAYQQTISRELSSYANRLANELQANADEIRQYVELAEEIPADQQELVREVLATAKEDAQRLHKEARMVIESFQTYATTTNLLCKIANDVVESQPEGLDAVQEPVEGLDGDLPVDDDLPVDNFDLEHSDLEHGEDLHEDHPEQHIESHEDMGDPMTDSEIEASVMGHEGDPMDAMPLNSVGARQLMRQKLASELVDEKLMETAHPKGGTTVSEIPGSDGLTHVETKKEQADDILKNVKDPVKIKVEARKLHDMVVAGQFTNEDLIRNEKELIATGTVDKETLAYYKSLYNVDAESREFASDLTTEHEAARKAAAFETEKVLLKRAYSLANDQAARGLIGTDSNAIDQEVDRLMQLDEKGFAAVKRLASQVPVLSKTASASNGFPLVGARGDEDVRVSSASQESMYAAALRGTRGTGF